VRCDPLVGHRFLRVGSGGGDVPSSKLAQFYGFTYPTNEQTEFVGHLKKVRDEAGTCLI
jgi:hypothetical protein